MTRSTIPLHKLPAALAMVAAIACGGAVLGENVGRSEIISRHGERTAPIADYRASDAAAPRIRDAVPDQYAITTPQGRYEVGELAQRGLYSQARFGGYEVAYEDDFAQFDDEALYDEGYWDRPIANTIDDGQALATVSDSEIVTEDVSDEEPLPVLAFGS